MELGRPAKLDSKNAAKNWPQKLAMGTGPGVLGTGPGVLGTGPGVLGTGPGVSDREKNARKPK